MSTEETADRLMPLLDIASFSDDDFATWAAEMTEQEDLAVDRALELHLLNRIANGVAAIAFLLLRQDEGALHEWRRY